MVDIDQTGSLTVNQVETFQEYEFVFKYCTKEKGTAGPISKGTVVTYTRPGATIKTDKGFVKDNGGHALFKNMRTEKNDNGITLIPLKGAGWTEDHNCLWFDLPTKWTGLDNNTAECYQALVKYHGVRPIGTWDSQASWVSQLN